MAPRTKTVTPERRKAVLAHLRRAPTPSGLYGLTCRYCGEVFGSVRADTKFCSDGHRNTYNTKVMRRHQREVAAKQAAIDDLVYDRPLSEMDYAMSRGWSMAVDPRAARTEEVGQEEEGWDLPDG